MFHPIVPDLLLCSLLICTLISENLGLEKSRSLSNPRKISVSANLDFFPGLAPGFFQGGDLKKISFAESEIFLGFETDLDFSRP